jgi:vacuolar-type H+-ATPase subunit F/Vma7
MSRIAAIGEAYRVQGLGLAGVLVLTADDPDEVRLRWSALPSEVALVILTPRADEALADRAVDPLTVVMPR